MQELYATCLATSCTMQRKQQKLTFALGGGFHAIQGVTTVATVCASISLTAALPLSRWKVSNNSCSVQ